MPGNTKAIVRDVNAQPAPQLFDPSKDAYDYLLGDKGAMRAVLYDASGNPLLTQANPGYADLIDRASRILGKISADDGAIAALGALAAAAITDPAQNASVIALLKGLLKQLQGTGTGAAPVQLTGSNVTLPTQRNSKVVVNTLINAQSVSPSGEINVDLGVQGESELYLLLNIDQQPWSMNTGVPWYPNGAWGRTETLYPKRQNVATTYPDINFPAISIVLGIDPFIDSSWTQPTTIADAKNIMIPPMPGLRARIRNSSTNIATVTLRVIRVWR